MNKCKSFNPSIDNNSKILILGSMPGVKSLEEQHIMLIRKTDFGKLWVLYVMNQVYRNLNMI